MAKRTQKVGVVGKYATRYGASLRKQAKKMEVTQRARYQCNFCGKLVRRCASCAPREREKNAKKNDDEKKK